MKFYIGLHHCWDAKHFDRACVSVRALKNRWKPIGCREVLIDSGAFTELSMNGTYVHPVSTYARELRRLHDNRIVNIHAAVTQDYMCEPVMLAKTGLTIADHQRLTIERYDALLAETLPFPIMPVLQGYGPDDYATHVHMYGKRLHRGIWTGVGSVCKRNLDPLQIIVVLKAIHAVRPDLKLHGFGVKITALRHPDVRRLLATSDSMAWSYHARRHGKDQNGWGQARLFTDTVNALIRRDHVDQR